VEERAEHANTRREMNSFTSRMHVKFREGYDKTVSKQSDGKEKDSNEVSI
jgi:hypothetical protein